MSALPVGRYRDLLEQLLQLNRQTAALRRELGVWAGQPQLKLDNEVMVDPWSSMESSNSPLTESGGPSASSDLEGLSPGQAAPPTASPHQPIVLDLSVPHAGRYGTTEAVIEAKASARHLGGLANSSPLHKTNHQLRQNGHQKRTNEFSLDLEQIELIDDDEEPSTSHGRKPHFLDEDYHLQKSDSCRIPKPHFLDSPSPDDDKFSDVTDPHFLDEERKVPNVALKKKDLKVYSGASHIRDRSFKDNHNFGHSLSDPRHSLDRRHHMLPGQASGSSDRHSSHMDGWSGDREPWHNQDSCSVKSFSSAGSGNAPLGSAHTQLDNKVDCVYSLLSLLSLSASNNTDNMSEYLLGMSHTIENCITMRQSGCIPLVVQLIHSKLSRESQNKAALALHNMVHAQPDDKAGRREARVLRLLEQVREYCQILEDIVYAAKEGLEALPDDMSKHPSQSVAALMKLSFDEEHRHVMCQLGGLQSLATLVTIDQAAHGSLVDDVQCVTMRKYSGMALTNLTFGDGNNKALLCSFKDFMMALVDQLQSPNDDMRQVTAAVLRNLSWRADTASKQILREVGAVKGLTLAAMTGHKEATLKSVLSALWNLTAHCSLNKVDICSVEGALACLVDMLSFNAPSKTLAIIENAGGILRNVSSHIAVREDYRQVLRERNCLKVLLQQLKSPSLTIVSNSCGTLWNLSARCQQDQQYLWEHGAVPMLRSLIHSKHKMIAMGSSAALKNLLNSKPGKNHITSLDSTARDLNLPVLPTLGARKQKALEQEIDQNLSETCENIEPATSPTTSNREEKLLLSAAERHLSMSLERRRMSSSSPLMGHLASQISISQSSHFGNYLSCTNTLLLQNSLQKGHVSRTMLQGRSESVNRSDSRDSVTSTHSDSVYERVTRNNKIPSHFNHSGQDAMNKNRGSCSSVNNLSSRGDRDFIKRYSKEGGLMKYDRLVETASPHSSMRNNYVELADDEICDQPIDYGQKYSETKTMETQGQSSSNSEYSRTDDFPIKVENTSRNSSKVNGSLAYGDYQETDLDQPTDYSLRYAEDQSDATSELSEGPAPSVHEDTMKHFCTEGTPYETPINFSTATSMSDLRAIGESNEKANIKLEPVDKDNATNSLIKQCEAMSLSDEKDSCSLEESKHDNDRVLSGSNQNVPQSSRTYESKFSSGMISPEKPVNYCEEGTPGYFSRVSSLSSLEEASGAAMKQLDATWSPPEPENEGENNGSYTPPIAAAQEQAVRDQAKEKDGTKAVTFVSCPLSVPNYAEETPLMFSRSSSLGSLSGCSVPDQPDDIGSVVSEFSRMTSGCLSPSEIPDSPTQSPLPRGEGVPASHSGMGRNLKLANKSPPQPAIRLRSVFEDEISTFKCEHTPAEFSTATSLSSLTIDDEPGQRVRKVFDLETRTAGVGSSLPGASPPGPAGGSCSLSGDNSERGAQRLRDGQAVSRDSEPESGDMLGAGQPRIPCRSSDSSSSRPGPAMTSSPNCTPQKLSSHSSGGHSNMDACKTYYTEDTPALLSKVGSQSDLSVLSIADDGEESELQSRCSNAKKDFSDDSSNTSGEGENLLEECIRSGMPKKSYPECRPSLSRNPGSLAGAPLRPLAGLPSYLVSQDEAQQYAVEGSPFLQHSLSSSLSDLTIDSHHSTRATLAKDLSRVPPSPKQSAYKYDSPQHQSSSPTGSLSSVSLGSDDGRLLDMAIRAGGPQTNEGSSSYSKDVQSKRSLGLDQKSHDSLSRGLDDQSDEHVTVLMRNDSLSSLSVDSLGSNDGEQALFEQCIKSGMPKGRPDRKWDDMHSKTLDKNFKARSAERKAADIPKIQARNHRSLERNRDERKDKTNERDPEFESLVAAGAFLTCSQRLTRTEEDDSDRALLEEAIYCGMPKKRDKNENPVHFPPPSKNQEQVDTDKCLDLSKNVQVTSVVASCSPRATSDVKTAVDIGNTARSTRAERRASSPQSWSKTTAGQQSEPPELSDKRLSLSGDASEDCPYSLTMRDGCDQPDGNKPAKPNSESSSFDFRESFFDTSNECKALDLSACIDESLEFSNMDMNQSNESFANEVLNDLENKIQNDLHISSNKAPITSNVFNESAMSASTKTLMQSVTSYSSLKFVNQTDEMTILESVTDKDTYSSSGKVEHAGEKQSSSDTWNENTCPNDVSFPTVSGSAPMIASFKSDLGDEVTCAGGLPDLLEESIILSDGCNKLDLTNQLCESLNSQSLMDETPTNENQKFASSLPYDSNESKTITPAESSQHSLTTEDSSKYNTAVNVSMIENEAARLALAMSKNSYEYPSCLTESGYSLHSLDLDQVKPPSHMGSLLSLTHSLSGNWDDIQMAQEREKHSSLSKKCQKTPRKKSLPIGIMVRRALGHQSNHGSAENLDSNAISNLDNVKPPSEMDDIFDMENSMISVASIVSEIADVRDVQTPPIVFDLKQPVHSMTLKVNTLIDLENINPPSLFEELTESTLEVENDDDDCLTHTLAYCPEIPSGSESGTPIMSDFANSSAESTPKKVKCLNKKYLTPKMKRQLARDRYKTYTIAAEIAIKEEEIRKKNAENIAAVNILEETIAEREMSTSPSGSKERKSRLNPKQRRQEDRARYQTQTVNITSLTLVNGSPETSQETAATNDAEIEALRRRLDAKKSMKQNRIENAERYKTRTLEETVPLCPEILVNDKQQKTIKSCIPKPGCSSSQNQGNINSTHSQLAEEAIKAFDYLDDHCVEDSLTVDIDCETISLVSNEDDSELNSLRMRTFTKSFRNYLPVIESPTAVDKCIEKNLKNINHGATHIMVSEIYNPALKDLDDIQVMNGDFCSLECDQNSGTESADQNHYSDTEVESPLSKGKPKIIKPSGQTRDPSLDSNGSAETDENVQKTVRGRRKALYVSPYKRNGSATKKSPARTTPAVKSAKAPIATAPPSTITSKIHTTTKTINATKRIAPGKPPTNSLRKNSDVPKPKVQNTIVKTSSVEAVTPPKPALVRQGTFTMEESSMVHTDLTSVAAPEKKPSSASKLVKPGSIVKAVVNTSPSRLPTPGKTLLKSPLRKTNSSEPPANKTNTNKIPKQTNLKNSSSNLSLQSNESGKTITLASKGTKFSSSSSINSAASSTSKPPTKDVTSKIASLWKKVEESKKTAKPDMRVWITNNENGNTPESSCNGETSQDSPVGKLIRSSTFEGPVKLASSIPTPPKQKSSIAIKISQSPASKYNSKVPVVKATGNTNAALKRSKM